MSRLRRRRDRVRIAESTEERGQRPLLRRRFRRSRIRSRIPLHARSGRWARSAWEICASVNRWAVHASASIAFSSAALAACSRHLTVPTGIPAIARSRRPAAPPRGGGRGSSGPAAASGRSRVRSRRCRRRRRIRSARAVLRRFGLVGLSPGMIGATDTSRSRTPMSAGHQRRVRDDPVEPAVKRRRIAQARKLSPRGHERILRCVRRVGVVRQDRPGEPVAAIDPRIDEHPEGRRIPGACTPNERVVGRRRRPRRSRHSIHLTLGPSILALARRDVAVDRRCRVSRCRRKRGGSPASVLRLSPNLAAPAASI